MATTTKNPLKPGVQYTMDEPFTQKIDEPNENTTYIGWAELGNASNGALPVWKIQKISKSGTVTTIAWCDSNTSFDNIWDDRATLTYA